MKLLIVDPFGNVLFSTLLPEDPDFLGDSVLLGEFHITSRTGTYRLRQLKHGVYLTKNDEDITV